MSDFLFFYLAVIIYILFLGFIILARVTHDKRPFRKTFKIHFFFSLLYLVLSFVIFGRVGFQLTNCLIGLILFYLFHYACFSIVLGQISRGFSLEICVVIFRNGGQIPQGQLLREIEEKKNIQEERLQVMTESPVVQIKGDSISLTSLGRLVVWTNSAIHHLWRLKYLGESESPQGQP